MTTYRVCDEATQENEDIDAASPQNAAAAFLVGYLTTNVDGIPVESGKRYSTLNVWNGDDCELTVPVIADGSGGVLSPAAKVSQ